MKSLPAAFTQKKDVSERVWKNFWLPSLYDHGCALSGSTNASLSHQEDDWQQTDQLLSTLFNVFSCTKETLASSDYVWKLGGNLEVFISSITSKGEPSFVQYYSKVMWRVPCIGYVPSWVLVDVITNPCHLRFHFNSFVRNKHCLSEIFCSPTWTQPHRKSSPSSQIRVGFYTRVQD